MRTDEQRRLYRELELLDHWQLDDWDAEWDAHRPLWEAALVAEPAAPQETDDWWMIYGSVVMDFGDPEVVEEIRCWLERLYREQRKDPAN